MSTLRRAGHLLTQPMNRLHLGTDKTDILKDIHRPFLLVADRSFKLPGPTLDLRKDFFNPLHKINYSRASLFVEIINAVFPGGDNTLTKQNSSTILLEALLTKPKPTKLDRLIPHTKDTLDAYTKVKRLLLSPILKRFLTNSTSINFNETLVAHLDDLTRFDRFVIGNFLIANFKGQIVIPDFGFYACDFHADLIRQGRLIAGVNFLEEVPPKLRNALLQIPTKIGRGTTLDDAEKLAGYVGLVRNTNEYNDFLAKCIEQAPFPRAT